MKICLRNVNLSYKAYDYSIDTVLEFDTVKSEWLVRDTLGKERTHKTSLRYSSILGERDKLITKCITLGVPITRFESLSEKFFCDTHDALVEELILELQKIESDDNIIISEYIRNDDIEGMATSALVTSGGQCYWKGHRRLGNAGFEVFPGEQDSFGWLSGCIQTKKGIIVFG